MSKAITSTELKQETRKIIKQVQENPNESFIVYTHKEPQMVIISYEKWQEEQRKWKKPSLAEIKKNTIKTGYKINSSEVIRKMRDDE